MARYCPNCGTEVEDSALFCPTCGQPIDQGGEAEIPPAPAWPESAADSADDPTRVEPRPEPEPAADDMPPPPPPVTAPPPAREERAQMPSRAAPPPPSRPPQPGGMSQPSLPVTWPVTLSGWLIGIGALLAALGTLIGMFEGIPNLVYLILLVLLLAIAASVFFSGSLPNFTYLKLATLVVVLIGFGVALDRLSFGGAGVAELLLFLGTAAAGIGAILLELGRDQPLGGPAG